MKERLKQEQKGRPTELPPRPPYSDVELDIERIKYELGGLVDFNRKEIDVLEILITGEGSSVTIGRKLGLSKPTVNSRLQSIGRKLGTKDHTHIAALLWSWDYVRIKEE